MTVLTSLKAYLRLGLLSMQSQLQYRFRFYFPFISGAIWLAVQVSLWTSLYDKSGLNAAKMGGLSLSKVIDYVILTYFISKLYPSTLIEDVSNDVRNGKLNFYLTRPMSYLGRLLSEFVGNKIISLILMLPVIILFSLIGGSLLPDETARQVFAGIIALAESLCLAFVWNLIISIFSFWIQETSSLSFWNSFISQILSGQTFPLSVFPAQFQVILEFTPFPWMNSFCVLVFLGEIHGLKLWEGLFVTFGWITVLTCLTLLLWKTAIRRYSGVGG